ncbi:hypothetical protein AX14_000245 [Amanita brunnescens Koide BX004]|nr:hypothetical protein AX14_000245 [Amanita brunnescens Koide BX004]
MSDMYSALHVSPKKKRRSVEADGDLVLTPKKLRTAPPTPPATKIRRQEKQSTQSQLPVHLSRLITIQTSLQHALSHALATCASSPSRETGIVRNVLTHLSLETYTGLTAQINLDDLRRLCWIWEWDGRASGEDPKRPSGVDDDDNPFLDAPTTSEDTEWVRGSMGFVISPTTHYFKSERKRVPAYGIGIEVEMDIDKDMKGGMAAVARWTAAADKRCADLLKKLENWANLHKGESKIPDMPLAMLPSLPTGIKMSSLTRTLVSGSPKAPSVPFSLPCPPSSPSKAPSKSSMKHPMKDTTSSSAVPLPRTTLAINSIKFPQTPSRKSAAKTPLTPHTPSSSASNLDSSRPSTPVRQRGDGAFTAPKTPTTTRQLALYERVRQRSLSASPTKARTLLNDSQGVMSQDQLLKLGQEEIRRRCLLGRLSGVAESIWMLFSTPVGCSSLSTPTRKRRALPASEVTDAIIKSSPIPISGAEADDSVTMLTKLCPFFLRKLQIAGEDWLEMPATNQNNHPSSDSSLQTPTKKSTAPSSPGTAKSTNSAEELVRRSPRSVKRETGGLRQVREIIRREIESQD